MIGFIVTIAVCSLDLSDCSVTRSWKARHPSVEACLDRETEAAAERLRAGGHEVVLLLTCDYEWPEV